MAEVHTSSRAGKIVIQFGGTGLLGRMATAHEIGAVVFLLGDSATYITGTNLSVDGDYTAK